MFYLNWQTFIQTSIMCNVNILSINYIALLHSSTKLYIQPSYLSCYSKAQKYQKENMQLLFWRFFETLHFSRECNSFKFQHNCVFPSCNLSKFIKDYFYCLTNQKCVQSFICILGECLLTRFSNILRFWIQDEGDQNFFFHEMSQSLGVKSFSNADYWPVYISLLFDLW